VGLAVGRMGSPEAAEKVVKSTDSGSIPGFKPAKNSVKRDAAQFIHPGGNRTSSLRKQHEQERTKQGSRIGRSWTEAMVLVFEEPGGSRKIGEPKFSIKSQSAGSNFEDISGIVGAQLVGNKGLVGIMSDSDRQQDNIPFQSFGIKIHPGQLLGYLGKVKCF